MAAKPFKKEMGRNHFQELKNEHLASFNHSQYFVEISNEYSLDQLLDPIIWGPQPKLKRGDLVTAMRADNAYFVTLIVEGTSAGYPTFRIFNVIERVEAAAEPATIGADGIEMLLTPEGAVHTVTVGGELVDLARTGEAADASFARLSGAA